jgi:hypothetical protein
MPSPALQALTGDLAKRGRVSADDALRLRREVFPDGVVSRDEADALIALEARVANNNDAWVQTFAEAIADHVLQFGSNVDDKTAAWLVARFGAGAPREAELHALLKILDHADSAPESLHAFVRERLAACAAGRAISAADVELMRRCVYAGDSFVKEDEARWLFSIDAESDGRANDASWQDFFVKAVLNHIMGSYAPSLLDAADARARQAWLENTRQTPVSNLWRIFSGGWGGYVSAVRSPNMADALDQDYEALNANAEEDAQLTLQERAWAVGMSKQDGKLTANEKALLTQLEMIQSPAA